MSKEGAHSDRETYLLDAITKIHHYADYYGLDWDHALSELRPLFLYRVGFRTCFSSRCQ